MLGILSKILNSNCPILKFDFSPHIKSMKILYSFLQKFDMF